MPGRLIRPQRGVRSAHDHPGAAGPESRRHAVTMRGVGRVHRDGHQINRAFVRDALVVFVHQFDLVAGFVNETRQIGHGKLGEIVELSPANPMDLLIFRRDQQEAFPAAAVPPDGMVKTHGLGIVSFMPEFAGGLILGPDGLERPDHKWRAQPTAMTVSGVEVPAVMPTMSLEPNHFSRSSVAVWT